MTRLYEGMFLIDNDIVRAGWQQAKSSLCDVLVKHGAEVQTARRWDERRLAYPIKKKNRATYLLTYFQLPTDAMSGLVREIELGDLVMRNLIVSAVEVTDEERQLAADEDGTDFVIPEPPSDDTIDRAERESEEPDAIADIVVPDEASAGADLRGLEDN